MNCPSCQAPTKVIDCNQIRLGFRRRRKCLRCDYRFSTISANRCSQVETVRALSSGPCPGVGYDSGDSFELWLTPDLSPKVRLDKLRWGFNQGLPKEAAVRLAQSAMELV